MTYKEQLTDPRWQKRRLEVLNRDEFTCQKCGDKTRTLHVHHRYYVSGRMAWEYPEVTYVTLCHECHEKQADPIRVRGWERALAMIVTLMQQLKQAP